MAKMNTCLVTSNTLEKLIEASQFLQQQLTNNLLSHNIKCHSVAIHNAMIF